MRQASRNIDGDRYITFAFCADGRHAPVYLRVSRFALSSLAAGGLILFVLLGGFAKNSAALLERTADYRLLRSENQLLNTKIKLASAKQKQCREHIHNLKTQEEEIKELLRFEDWPLNNDSGIDHALVAAHRIVSPKGEFGRVLVDGQPVVEYFDDSPRPLAYQRALVTAEKLKKFLAGHSASGRYTTRKTGSAVYAYINGQPIFVVLPADLARLQEPLSAEQLAKYWLQNIQTALAGRQKAARGADRLAWLKKENRRKSRLHKTLYPSINYPVYALAPADAASPLLSAADHLLKLSRQEIATYDKSFQELKADMQAYKERLEYTPSVFPVHNSYVFSGFGWRQHPILSAVRFHSGVDLPSWRGAPIYATASGTVKKTGWSNGYGWYVELAHQGGFSTLYGHNSVNLVEAGQKIRKGQLIARVGSTGLSEGDHCHYEVRYYDRPVDPVRFLNLNIFTANLDF
ncbi:MAG: peptidoglycan DD-metalloendopeptidase family protein [Candidatus Margulisbacteria bacterium]|jgi:murein DD-endopeptidase MepM/ murein hydrolase activator NlpD|nr:peptidoglycan DD-metalloendopeptidase family protein [Candidatus Margulisiibacteriota bacterium]